MSLGVTTFLKPYLRHTGVSVVIEMQGSGGRTDFVATSRHLLDSPPTTKTHFSPIGSFAMLSKGVWLWMKLLVSIAGSSCIGPSARRLRSTATRSSSCCPPPLVRSTNGTLSSFSRASVEAAPLIGFALRSRTPSMLCGTSALVFDLAGQMAYSNANAKSDTRSFVWE